MTAVRKTTQYAFRTMWTEYRRNGPKSEPTARACCGHLWTFPDRQTDPVNGIDTPGLVAMARSHMTKAESDLAATGSDIEIVCESRLLSDPDGEGWRPVGSWEPVATIRPGAEILWPDLEGAHNAQGIREAMDRLGRFPDTQETP